MITVTVGDGRSDLSSDVSRMLIRTVAGSIARTTVHRDSDS